MTAAVTPERLVSGLPPFYIRYSPRAISPYTEPVLRLQLYGFTPLTIE